MIISNIKPQLFAASRNRSCHSNSNGNEHREMEKNGIRFSLMSNHAKIPNNVNNQTYIGTSHEWLFLSFSVNFPLIFHFSFHFHFQSFSVLLLGCHLRRLIWCSIPTCRENCYLCYGSPLGWRCTAAALPPTV